MAKRKIATNPHLGQWAKVYADRIDPELGRVPVHYAETHEPIMDTYVWFWQSGTDKPKWHVRDNEVTWLGPGLGLVWGKRVDGKWRNLRIMADFAQGLQDLSAARDAVEFFCNGHMLPENDSAYQ